MSFTTGENRATLPHKPTAAHVLATRQVAAPGEVDLGVEGAEAGVVEGELCPASGDWPGVVEGQAALVEVAEFDFAWWAGLARRVEGNDLGF